VKELEELNRRCIAAVTAEVERGGDDLLERDEDWVVATMLRVFDADPPLVARALQELGDALTRGERSDADVRAFRGMQSAGHLDTAVGGLVDVIYSRSGGVMDALHDLGVASDWSGDVER
jgi:hypothetical protein